MSAGCVPSEGSGTNSCLSQLPWLLARLHPSVPALPSLGLLLCGSLSSLLSLLRHLSMDLGPTQFIKNDLEIFNLITSAKIKSGHSLVLGVNT